MHDITLKRIFIARGVALLLVMLIPILVFATTNAYAHSQEYDQGYAAGIAEWDHWNSDQLVNTQHTFECPLIHTAPHSDYCRGYDAALKFSTSDG
jgi:hypothetical protein